MFSVTVKLGDLQEAIESFERSLEMAKVQGDEPAQKAIAKALEDLNEKIVQGLKEKEEEGDILQEEEEKKEQEKEEEKEEEKKEEEAAEQEQEGMRMIKMKSSVESQKGVNATQWWFDEN